MPNRNFNIFTINNYKSRHFAKPRNDITHGDYVIDFKLSPREWFKRNQK